MSEASRGLEASDQRKRRGSDLFGFYTRQIVDLLSGDDECLPSSKLAEAVNVPTKMLDSRSQTDSSDHVCPLFSDSIESQIPDTKRESLKSALRQSVRDLSEEVDETVDPVIRIRHILSRLRSKNQHSKEEATPNGDVTVTPNGDVTAPPCKKLKTSSSSTAVLALHASRGSDTKESGAGQRNSPSSDTPSKSHDSDAVKECTHCGAGKDLSCRVHLDGNEKCTSCGARLKVVKDSSQDSKSREELFSKTNKEADKETAKLDEDLKFLLEIGTSQQIEEAMARHSADLYQTLDDMEKQLEELLDAVVSRCRPMTSQEKQQLTRYIKNLPPKNLDRIVEIINRGKPSDIQTCDEMLVDLEKQGNLTLWRLYFYAQAVENAAKLAS